LALLQLCLYYDCSNEHMAGGALAVLLILWQALGKGGNGGHPHSR
jgi:hypothetical protein